MVFVRLTLPALRAASIAALPTIPAVGITAGSIAVTCWTSFKIGKFIDSRLERGVTKLADWNRRQREDEITRQATRHDVQAIANAEALATCFKDLKRGLDAAEKIATAMAKRQAKAGKKAEAKPEAANASEPTRPDLPSAAD